jgi:hypothetical protein
MLDHGFGPSKLILDSMLESKTGFASSNIPKDQEHAPATFS